MIRLHKSLSAVPELRSFSRGWLILPVCLGNIMVSNGVAQSFSVIFVALISDYQWGRAELSGIYSLYVASVLGMTGISAMAGRVLCGTFSDTIGRESAYTIFMGCGALGVIALFFLSRDHSWLLWFYVGLMGLGLGVGGALFTPIMADLFQGPNLGRIMGVCSVFSGFGAGLGPWFAGWIHDVTGSYAWSLVSVEAAILGAIVFVWLAGPRHSVHSMVRRA